MNNRNGFTLVELLAVVVLLSILLVMAVPAVLSFTSRMKQDMFCNKVETVVKSAQLYGQDNMSSIVNGKVGKTSSDSCVVNGTQRLDNDAGIKCVKINVTALLAKGYLSKESATKNGTPNDFFDPRDGSSMKSNLCSGAYYANGSNIARV